MRITRFLAQGFLAGKSAIVTGSTSGIGESVAKALASKGANVVINGFGDPDVINKLVESIKKDYNVGAKFIGGDLTKQADVKNLHTEAVAAFPGGIDILVNNAGFQHVCPIEDFPLDIFEKMLAVMVTCPWYLTQMCMGTMKQKGFGRIVNIASAHGHVASPNKTGYVSCKHAAVGMTKAVGVEVAGSGVTCNAICPGYVETPLFVKQAEDRAKAQGISYADASAQILQVHPSKTAVKLDELSEAVLFLCGHGGNQMTGTSIIMDGGWTAC